ncbi:MAG: hypothetical protein M3N04_07800 [Actinomycetota bacterium]|nr:hypothetical protein [Actinomycetota bacterium]
MSDWRPLIAPLAVVCLVAIALALFLERPRSIAPGRAGADDGARYALQDDRAEGLPPAGPLRFAPAVAASDQQIVLRAVADARPEARRLVALVAAVVTVSLGEVRDGVAGQTSSTAAGYDVVLDLGSVYRAAGMRGVRRLVLHELAHVIDHALVGTALEAQLDAATPPGFGCDGGNSGACAAREERFAESFAKWATGDIGNDLYLGYRVPPPTSLSAWGEPLASLAR